ncbi:CH-like domain in sperm protein domain-containing protein [Phthorimaea operculella]|nr:CH-like domain in sperm protein domain-containing protein [Phthorimaea operculella]
MTTNALGAPIPLADIESVLAWVDTFKLSRPTKKINRDFSDAVLLAEILAVHYPKLVEMHNYPARNSHSLKLNNWMTLNRKVLKKLKLNLCCNTMEQLANCTPGVIERVLVMVRDKIKRDEELERSTREAETNMSSGGSYYEACGDEENVLVVPVKTRVNGVLETIQQKVVSYDAYVALKTELKDAQDTTEILKQKVEHLDSLIKLKDERITELQKQLERKQSRRGKEPEVNIPSVLSEGKPEAYMPSEPSGGKEPETNILSVPYDEVPSPTIDYIIAPATKKASGLAITIPSKTKIDIPDETIVRVVTPKTSITNLIDSQVITKPQSQEPLNEKVSSKTSKLAAPIPTQPSITEVTSKDKIITDICDLERIKSDVFKEANVYEDKQIVDGEEEFKDSEPGNIVAIEETIKKELVG